MATQKTLAATFVVVALVGAAGAGWMVLRPRTAAPVAPAPAGPEQGHETPPVRKGPDAPAAGVPASTEGDEDDETDLDREPSGPTGGATTEEILAAGAAGNWLEVQRLLSIAGSSDPRVTEMIAKALSDLRWRFTASELAKFLKDPGAPARFMEIAKAEGDENTRSAALQACAILGAPGVAEAAADILRGARQGSILANGAAAALGRLGSPEAARTLVDMLRGSLGTFRSAVFVEALAKVQGAEALAELGRLANDQGYDAKLRESLIAALGRTRNPAVVGDLLKAAKEGETQELRHAALGALGVVGSPEGVVELLNVVQGGSADDKLVAAIALQGVRSKAAGPLLEQALKGSVPAEIRAHLVTALGSCGGRSSLETLGALAGDTEESVGIRTTAVRSIGQIGDTAGSGIVLGVLESSKREEAALQRECVGALNGIATKTDLPRLKKYYQGVPEQTPAWYGLGNLIRALETGRNNDVTSR